MAKIAKNKLKLHNEALDLVRLERDLTMTEKEFVLEKPFLAYLTLGEGTDNSLNFEEGDLIRGDQIYFKATSDVTMIVMQAETSE